MSFPAAGRLCLLEPIGAGSGGPVRRAFDLRTRRYVAVQRRPDAGPFVVHPHVLPHEQVGAYAVSPLVSGGSLERLLASSGALPAGLVAQLLDQLLDALGALHAVGWIHGDLKPGNLLVDAADTGASHLWLADLAGARRVGQKRPDGGTPGYVAPEARRGAAADPRQDLYATGATAAELLTGRVPRTSRDLRRGPLRALLRRLLDPDPASRPATAAEARTLLGRSLADVGDRSPFHRP